VPRDKVLLGFLAEQLQVVQTHKLPDDSQDVLLVAFSDVLGSESNQPDLELAAALNAMITVLSSSKQVLGLLFNF
jgi:hypothetical protein